MAGTWVFSPKGLAGLDPKVISYAPPGFPFLVGLAYGLLGESDVAAILVSIVAGTLTIPIVGWLGYRTFGRGAGAAASAFAALSGPHIAFSRMALTDCSFLLFWLLAIGLGQRFLEKPGFPRAIALGLAVGVAQLFKYNGWIAGVVVALSAGMWAIVRLEDRAVKSQRAVWGWGLLAAIGRRRRLLALVPIRRSARRVCRAPRPPARLPEKPFLVAWPRNPPPRSRTGRSPAESGG